MSRSRPFVLLRALREFERRHFSFIETLEDYDLVREIGYAQHNGRPMTMRKLFTLGLGSVATCQRRLRRLRDLGVITQRRYASDARITELLLLRHVAKSFASYEKCIRRAAADS